MIESLHCCLSFHALYCEKPNNIKQKKHPEYLNASLWYLQESNQGHTDFQSVALPTELRYRFC